MSVIFRALKKVKAPPGDGIGVGRLHSRHDIYTFRRIAFSPVVVIVGALILALVATIGVYGYQVVQDFTTTGRGTNAAPAPPTYVPVEQEPLGAPAEPLPDWRNQLGTADASYTPPGGEGSSEPGETEETAISQNENADYAGVYSPPSAGVSPEDDVPSEEITGELNADRVQVAEAGPPAEADGTTGPDTATAGKSAEKKRKSTARKSRYGHRGGRPVSDIVPELQVALSQKNSTRVTRLLDELGRVKGEESNYVIKMRAYWDMRRESYESAAERWKIILRRNADDLEAGLNLSIAEIQLGRIETARARLNRLVEIYPENAEVYELFQKIR